MPVVMPLEKMSLLLPTTSNCLWVVRNEWSLEGGCDGPLFCRSVWVITAAESPRVQQGHRALKTVLHGSPPFLGLLGSFRFLVYNGS